MENFSLFEKEEKIECKPFIKCVGGKGQLLPEISKLYPVELGKTINKYAEIFIGGGAVLFDILSKYRLDEVYISDKNLELINTYKTIKDNSERIYHCECCGLEIDRDYNASINILRKGLEILREEKVS